MDNMDDHLPRKYIAEDILAYCRKNKKRFYTAKYNAGKIICHERGRPYTPNELAAGLTYAHRQKTVERVSNNRWRVLSFEFEWEKNMSELLAALEQQSKKEMEDIGSHEPMIYIDKNGKLVPYYLVLTSPHGKEKALRTFREMVTKEGIKRYWTVTEAWVSNTRGLAPSMSLNKREMLMISEYDAETMENRRMLLPFERKFDDNELLRLSEEIRKMERQRGIELPELSAEDLKDPKMLRILTSLHPDRAWSGTIVWGEKESFTIGPSHGEFTWVDRWNFFMEDTSEEIGAKDEQKRIEDLIKEIKELDLSVFMNFAHQFREQLQRRGIEIPPVPPEEDIRQILIRLAESGSLVKINDEPINLHEMVKEIKDADSTIPASQIHAMGDE